MTRHDFGTDFIVTLQERVTKAIILGDTVYTLIIGAASVGGRRTVAGMTVKDRYPSKLVDKVKNRYRS